MRINPPTVLAILAALGMSATVSKIAHAHQDEGEVALADEGDQRMPDYIDDGGMPVYVDDEQPQQAPPTQATVAQRASSGRYRYCGSHPVPREAGGGFHTGQEAHEHEYPPFDAYLFAERDDCYHFIGDPRDFGYTGETYSYYGSHPIAHTHGGGFCYYTTSHFHLWAPFGPYFVMSDGWWGWAGPLPYWYWWYYPSYYRYHAAYYPRYYGHGRYYLPPGRGGLVGRPPPPPRPNGYRPGGRLVVQNFDRGAMVPHRPANLPQGAPTGPRDPRPGSGVIRNHTYPTTRAQPLGGGAPRPSVGTPLPQPRPAPAQQWNYDRRPGTAPGAYGRPAPNKGGGTYSPPPTRAYPVPEHQAPSRQPAPRPAPVAPLEPRSAPPPKAQPAPPAPMRPAPAVPMRPAPAPSAPHVAPAVRSNPNAGKRR
jgi:hypothetical protein